MTPERMALYDRARLALARGGLRCGPLETFFPEVELSVVRAFVERTETRYPAKTPAPSRRIEKKPTQSRAAQTVKEPTVKNVVKELASIRRELEGLERRGDKPTNLSGRGAELDVKMGLVPPHEGIRTEGNGAILILGSVPPREFPNTTARLALAVD